MRSGESLTASKAYTEGSSQTRGGAGSSAQTQECQTGDCGCLGDSWLRQNGKEALGSQSEILDLPPRCASWPRCSSAQLSGTLSFQLLLSDGFLLPRYGFGFNNS